MYARFNNTAQFSNIIDVDISMYDEIMVSSTSSPEFSITFAYDHLNKYDIDSFAYWWGEVKGIDLSVVLFDDNGNVLASGFVFEYNEDYEGFYLEIRAKHNQLYSLKDTIEIDYIFNWRIYSTSDYSEVLKLWFVSLWNRAGFVNPCNFAGSSNIYFNHLAQILFNTFNHLYIKTVWSGTKSDFIKQMAQIINAKAIFMEQGDYSHFTFYPFKKYSSPIDITGYVSNCERNTKESDPLEIELFESVKILNKVSPPSGDNVYYNFTQNFKNAVLNNLTPVTSYEIFKIWGYASQIINTGQTIKLNGTDYYVKDISYEFERLNDIKSFNCEAVRFIE